MSIIDIPWLTAEGKTLAAEGTPKYPLVAGGGGGLGNNVVTLLGHIPGVEKIKVLDMKPPLTEVLLDLEGRIDYSPFQFGTSSDEDLVKLMEGVDCVISVFTPHVQLATAEEFLKANVDGTQQLVRACEVVGCRLVHVSSVAVTSHFKDSHNENEDCPLPRMEEYKSAYDISKRKGEIAVLDACKDNRICGCSLRAGGILLSPWDNTFGNALQFPGFVFGPVGSTIDFIDGRDVARATVIAAQALATRPKEVSGQPFYVTGEGMQLGRVAKFIGDCLGYPFVHIPDCIVVLAQAFAFLYYHVRALLGLRVPGIPQHRFMDMVFYDMTFDNTRAAKVLNFTCKIPPREALARIANLHVEIAGVSKGPGTAIRLITMLAVGLLAIFGLLVSSMT